MVSLEYYYLILFQNFNLGDITENFEFTINHDTEVQQSCSAMLNGELFVIGGENKKNQVILKKYILLLIIYWECVYVPIIDVPKIVYFKQMIVQFLGMTVNFQ